MWSLWKTVWHYMGFPGGSVVKNPPASAGDVDSIPVWKDPREKEMATHSSSVAQEIPWPEESGGLQSIGSKKCQTQFSD